MEHIRKIRNDRGLTTDELGAAVGVTHAAVLNWERPNGYPHASKLPRIADALGVSIDALYGRNNSIAQEEAGDNGSD